MKNIIFFLIFIIFNLNHAAHSEDIDQVELDGMSLGDSLLNFYSKKEIKENILQYFDNERDYYIVYYNKNLTQYNDFEIYLKTNDKNYEIKGINAGIYPNNLDECIDTLEEIANDISISLNIVFKDDSSNHHYYKNSYINGRTTELNGGFLRIDCMFFNERDKKLHPRLIDNLSVMLKSDEIEQWAQSGYK